MKFPTAYDKFKVESVPGSHMQDVYSAEYDDHGMLVLEKVGEEDRYEYIQSFADSVDIYNILRRYESGEVDVLQRVQGFYKDTTGLPKNYRDILNMNIKTQTFFDSLPVEVKQEFSNNYGEFMVALGEKGFEERIRKLYETDTESGALDISYNHDVKDVIASADDE